MAPYLPGLLCLCLLALAVPARAADVITEIRFVGNQVTRPQILLQEMSIHVRDPVDPARIAASRQAIMNLGLFSAVSTKLLPDPRGGSILQITVKEKYYLLPIPRANRNADGDISYGGELRWDNVAGLNQQLDVIYSIGLPAGSESRTHDVTVNYSYPRLAGTPYNLDLNGRRLTEYLFPGDPADSQYNHDMKTAGFLLSRYLTQAGPSQGWRVGGGVSWSENLYRLRSGTPGLYTDTQSTTINTIVDNTDVKDHIYSRNGYSYGYQVSWAPALLNSDTYLQQQAYWRNYMPIGQRAYQSLYTQVRFGVSTGFTGTPYLLGGSDSLRGYPRGSIAGKSFAVANIEFLSPLRSSMPALRGVVFADVGNAYSDDRVVDVRNLKTSVGIGLRVALKWFVKIQLRLDYAYAVDAHTRKAYAGTKDAF